MVSILSPYGEGYCVYCKFVEGLNEEGLLDVHIERAGGAWDLKVRKDCPGSLTKPPARTPYAAASAKFRTSATVVQCPRCGRRLYATAGDWMPEHTRLERPFDSSGPVWCKGADE